MGPLHWCTRPLLTVLVLSALKFGALRAAHAAPRLRGATSILPSDNPSTDEGPDTQSSRSHTRNEGAIGEQTAADRSSVHGGGAAFRVSGHEEGSGGDAADLMTHQQALRFLAIGDWGRQGEWNESGVARAMAARAAQGGLDFVVSVGDNFYPREPFVPLFLCCQKQNEYVSLKAGT